MAETIKIGGELESTATGNVVAAASAIKDKVKNKYQGEINAETDASLSDRYTKAETYNKTELNNMITTPNQKFVSVVATDQTTAATDVLPATGEADTIYRVGNWDGTQYNDSVFSEYAWNGSAYIKLSTKSQVGEVYDISANHAGATYADLSAALGTNGANIPQSLRKGGMSVKFVLTSDNNYTQFRCKTQSFSANPEDWYFEGDDTLAENPEYIRAITDGAGHLLGWIRKEDGGIDWAVGVPKPVKDYVDAEIAKILNGSASTDIDGINKIIAFLDDFSTSDTLAELLATKVDKEEGKSLIPTQYIQEAENPEYIHALTDNNDKITEATKKDGGKLFSGDVEVKGDISAKEVSAETMKLNGIELSPTATVDVNSIVEDPEGRLKIETDTEGKIISHRKKDGTLVESVGLEATQITTNSLNLTNEGMRDFQQALKNSGFQPGGGGDWSERENIELPEPKHYSLLNIVVDRLPINDSDVSTGYIEYYDGLGNYFKMDCSLEAQGQTSRIFARTDGKGNYTLDLPKDVKFGSWVPQDSFHLKGSAKDVVRGMLPTSYKWAYMFMEALNAKPNRVLMDESDITTTHATGDRITDWPTDARCLPDGFPVEVYINDEYWGLYSWQLKKHRKNYSMDKKDYTSFFIDPDAIMTDDLQNGIWNDGPDALMPNTDKKWWTGFDIKGPKDLYCMDGSKFDGDAPKELIDSTSQYYDATNKAHKGSQTTKNLIRSFQTKYLEVKTLIDNDSIEEAKAAFNLNFDYNSCMYVYIFNCLMNNTDSIKKNTLFGMYKSGKICAFLWDLDNMYGEGWTGRIAGGPSSSLWTGIYTTAEWPLKLLWDLYEDEIKANYAKLRKAAIINLNTWHNIVFKQWVNRIGEEAYNRDIKKWPETPSYRENYTNTDYWVEDSAGGLGSYSEWQDNVQYVVGDIVAIRMHALSNWYLRYKCVQANINECPVTKFYTGFPTVGGFYDSPKRWEKWIDSQIMLCDIKNNFMEELVADFIAYRSTNPDYTIQCINMNLENNLTDSYIFIEGHITRHETEIEGQTVSVYTITGGNVTYEDTSKTYTSVMVAVEAASQQTADVPSEDVFYIEARARNIEFEWKNN